MGSSRIPVLPLVVLLAAWLALWNVLGYFTFGHGARSFFSIAAIAVLCLFARRLAAWLGASRAGKASVPSPALAVVLWVAVAAAAAGHVKILSEWHSSPNMVDVGLNTYRAARHFFVSGMNPYANPSQVAYRIAPGPHVEVRAGQVLMFGVPYRYGYPYYPAMFASYEPFRRLTPGIESIREGNAVFMVLAVVGVVLLARRLADPSVRSVAGPLAALAFLAVWGLAFTVFAAGVTDLVIVVFALWGLLALLDGRHLLAGLLFGLTLDAKLLPSAFLLPLLAAWYWRRAPRGAGWRFAAGYGAAIAVVLVPFVVWDPRSFLSATTLYYLTQHALGDDSSLWYSLPAALKGPFFSVGVLLSSGTVAWGLRKRDLQVPDVMLLSFLAQLAFVAFNKMIHLNYFWSVSPLGCVCFALSVLDGHVTSVACANRSAARRSDA